MRPLAPTKAFLCQIASHHFQKNSHVISMGVPIMKCLFDRLYWVAVKYKEDRAEYRWTTFLGGFNLEPNDVLYWAGGRAPLGGDGLCEAYNTTDLKLYSRNCTELLPYICEYTLEDNFRPNLMKNV